LIVFGGIVWFFVGGEGVEENIRSVESDSIISDDKDIGDLLDSPDNPQSDNGNIFVTPPDDAALFINEDYIIKKNFGNLSYFEINNVYEGIPSKNAIAAESITYKGTLGVITVIGVYSEGTDKTFSNYINGLKDTYEIALRGDQKIYEAFNKDEQDRKLILWYSDNLILDFIFYEKFGEDVINMEDVNSIIEEYLNEYPSSL
jgi:hypothetical protein